MKKFLIALCLFGIGVVRAETVGDSFLVWDSFHAYTTGGIGQYDGSDYAYDYNCRIITAPDGTIYYGGAGGSEGMDGYLPVTVILDQPGMWHVEDYSEHDEPLRHDSTWSDWYLEVDPQ